METADTRPNSAQFELWNGRGGEIWTRLQVRLDQLFQPLTDALLTGAAAKSGESILEIGCGCGDLTLSLAKICGPEGQIAAMDISKPMLERAKARDTEARVASPHMAPIVWIEADAMIHPFATAASLAISRFGVMFFEDPAAAFQNIRKALTPNGRIIFLSWGTLDKNPWIAVPLASVHELIEPPPPLPPGSPGPFAFADPDRVIAILRRADFANATALPVNAALIMGNAAEGAADKVRSAIEDALQLALESGPVAALLRTAGTETILKVRDQIAARLRPHYNASTGQITLDASCWLYEASVR